MWGGLTTLALMSDTATRSPSASLSHVRMGFIGAGMISKFSAEHVTSHPDASLVAVYDPSVERREKLKENHAITRTHDSVEAMLADDEIDSIYVAVPNKFHAELALRVLESGRHCLLEKPFALNFDEARRVADVAAKSGKTFCIGMNQRFPAGRQRLRHLISEGRLGEIYHAKGYWLRRAGIPRMQTWFGHDALSGGGCLLDIGVHMLDLVLYLTDNFEPVSVTGQTYSKIGPTGRGEGGWGMSDRDPSLTFDVDDLATAFIRFRNEMTVSLDVSWAVHLGEEGRDGADIFGTDAGGGAAPSRFFRPQAEGDEYDVFDLDEPTGEFADVPVMYEHCERFHNFINAVLGREELCCKVEQSLVVQQVLDAIYESAKTGRQVEIDPVPVPA